MSLGDMTKLINTGELKNVYLFFGPETYLKTFYSKTIIKRLGCSADEIVRLDDSVSADDLENAVDSSPLFSTETVVYVRNSGLFSSKNSDLSFLENISEDSYVIFKEDNVDVHSAAYKLVSSIGIALECRMCTDAEITQFLAHVAASMNRQIDVAAIVRLISGVGRNLDFLVNEVKKLAFLVPDGGTITVNEVTSATELTIEAKIFDLTDAIAEKKSEKALNELKKLISDKVPPPQIFTLLSRQFISLYDVYCLATESDLKAAEISKKTGMPEFLAIKYLRQAKTYKKEALVQILSTLSDLDSRVKSGRIDPVKAIEIFIGGL